MPKSLVISIAIISVLALLGGAFLVFSHLSNNNADDSPQVVEIQSSVENDINLLDYITDKDKTKIEIDSDDYIIYNFKVKFTKSGNYTIKIIENGKNIKIINIAIISNIQSLSFDFANCELFYNKSHNFKQFKILDNSTEISLNYVGLSLTYNDEIISVQNNKIIALNKGNTTLVAQCEGFSASANIIVNEWNYAQSISFEEQDITLKNIGDNYELSPNIVYLNSEELRENVVYDIISGSRFCELNGNIITPIDVGQVEIRASIKNAENSYISAYQTISIEPLINLNIGVVKNNSDSDSLLSVKSGTKADGSFEYYKLKIISNLKFNATIINQIYNFIQDNYGEDIDLSNDYNQNIQENTLFFDISFKSTGILNLKLNISDNAQNYIGSSFSNELQINQIPFVQNINLIPNEYTDKNLDKYSVEMELQSNIEVFTIYNAKGNGEELLCAMGDRKPYFVEFDSNVECDFELLGNSHVTIEGNKITSANFGLQNILVSALDGSGVTKLIAINVVDIELENYVFSDVPTTYTFFIDENPILNCTPKYIPCYATIKPAFSIELDDYNYATVEGNNIIALKLTESNIIARITLEGQVVHTITFDIYQKRPVISILNDNLDAVTIISQAVDQACVYNVLVDGKTPTNVDISYKFLSDSGDYEDSYPNLTIVHWDSLSFILTASAPLSTKLKIIINQFEFEIDVIIL